MGVSTDGQLCYGVAFDEDFVFPWGEDGIEDWWAYQVHGFKHSFDLFDSDGAFLDCRLPSQERLDAYFAERRAFDEAHPLPVELVNYCSDGHPMYIVAAVGTLIVARRGSPEVIDPAQLSVTTEQHDALVRFFADHDIEMPREPSWLLSSLWM